MMANTIEYYLSKGFDRKTAEYFAGGRKKSLMLLRTTTLLSRFVLITGKNVCMICVLSLKKGTVFETLAKMENFRRVYVDNTHCIAWDIDPNVDSSKVWNNKVDLSPDGCYLDSVPLGGVLGA